jgi:23S rRNA (pseudouridine1915-N3)-methyltransferase
LREDRLPPMKWHLMAIGKPKLPFAAAGADLYVGRIRSLASLDLQVLKGGNRDAESAMLLRRSEGMLRIVLDERGQELTSRELAARILEWEQRSVRSAALLLGGAEGHSESIRMGADFTWALSRLTLQHELALVIALEQIYRAYTINAGLPYHRD